MKKTNRHDRAGRPHGNNKADERNGNLATLSPVRFDEVVPRYHQIKQDLIKQIRMGHWRPDQEVPSEAQLGEYYGVSRGTIRRAVEELSNEGLVYKVQGRGTFVSGIKFENSVLASYGYHRSSGVPYDEIAHVYEFDKRKATKDVAGPLGIGKGDEYFFLKRVRVAEGLRVTVEHSYFPGDLGVRLADTELARNREFPVTQHENLYPWLERECGLFVVRAEEIVRPALADDEVSELLGIEAGSPVFLVERTSYTYEDRIGEFRRAYARGDLYGYHIHLR